MSEIEMLREQNKRVLEKLELIIRANQDLENQLAEKEKEIIKCISLIDSYQDEALMYKSMVDKKDIEKTNFAIEQLEKVREKIRKEKEELFKLLEKNKDNELKGVYECLILQNYEFIKTIDNQIKELKEKLWKSKI